MKLFRQKIMDRMGTEDEPYAVTLPTASTQSSAGLCWHLVEGEGGPDLLLAPDQWRTYQTERGLCWQCGDQLPTGARFCIVCRAEMPATTGETERLYVVETGKTERLCEHSWTEITTHDDPRQRSICVHCGKER